VCPEPVQGTYTRSEVLRVTSARCKGIGLRRELSLIGVIEDEEKRSDLNMRRICQNPLRLRPIFRQWCVVVAGLLLTTPAFAQGTSPWENAVNVLQQAFTSTIARGLSLVAIVVAGLTFAFGEGGSKRILAGVLFGVGMAIAAVNFLSWLFPGG
jgi:type IV secretion system protein TrbC